MVARGWSRGGINWRLGLTYIHYKILNNLLYNTGNSTQYSVMTYTGKNLKRKKKWIFKKYLKPIQYYKLK